MPRGYAPLPAAARPGPPPLPLFHHLHRQHLGRAGQLDASALKRRAQMLLGEGPLLLVRLPDLAAPQV